MITPVYFLFLKRYRGITGTSAFFSTLRRARRLTTATTKPQMMMGLPKPRFAPWLRDRQRLSMNTASRTMPMPSTLPRTPSVVGFLSIFAAAMTAPMRPTTPG